MKKICLFILICLSNYIFSQPPFRNESELKKNFQYRDVISLKNGDFIQISSKRGKYCFQKLDSSLREIKTNKVSIKKLSPDKVKFSSVVHLKDKYFCLFVSINKKTKTYTYYSLEIDINNLSFVGEMNPINSPQKIRRGSINSSNINFVGIPSSFDNVNDYYKNIYVNKTSPDSSKFMIAYTIETNDAENNKGELGSSLLEETIYLQVTDNNLKKQWSNEFVLKNKSGFHTIKDYCVTNNGEIISIVKFLNNFYEIHVYSSDSLHPKIIQMELPASNWLEDAKILALDSSRYKIVGSYVAEGKTQGFYTINFNLKTSKYEKPIFFPFTKYELSDSLKTLLPRAILKSKDNSYKIIYEKTDIQADSYYVQGAGMSTIKHTINEIYGDVYIGSINKKGELEWIKKFQKLQQKKRFSPNSTPLSIECGIVDDTLHIVYSETKYPSITEITIDPQGNFKKIFLGHMEYFQFLDKTSLGVLNKNLIFYRRKFQYKNRFFFVKPQN